MNKSYAQIIAEKYGTPSYVFDMDLLSARVNKIREILDSNVNLCYAIKANPFIVSEMAELVDRIEVCSPGELEICISKDIDPSKILLSGVNKLEEDIRVACKYGVRTITIESIRHMVLVQKIASEINSKVRVYLRLTSGTQFGLDEEDIVNIITNKSDYSMCEIIGIHYFVGTQRKQIKQQNKDIGKLQEFLDRMKTVCSFYPEEIEYGPGLYYPYFVGEEDDDFHQLIELNNEVVNLISEYSVTIEMGRYYVAECGYYLSKVDDVKTNNDRNYAILDGGIHHLSYYGGGMGLKSPKCYRIHQQESEDGIYQNSKEWTLCGSLCTTFDILISSYTSDEIQVGDIFVFKNAGAYSSTESMGLFLSRKLPVIIQIKNGTDYLVRNSINTSGINQ